MDIYSKEIDEEIRRKVDEEFVPLDPNKDHLDADPIKEDQSHFCISFLPPNESRNEQVEALLYTYFILNKTNINDLYELVKNAKEQLDKIAEDPEEKDDPLEIEKKRTEEEFYQQLLNDYQTYKKENKAFLNDRLVKHFGKDIEKIPLQGALKVRGAYKSEKKAFNKGKNLSKLDGFTVFVGEMGKWMPFNPDKNRLENYKTTEEELNKLMIGQLEEREKAKNSFGLRTELLKRQGKKVAEEIKNKNLEDIKKGMFDSPEYYTQKKVPLTDAPLTVIDDWSEDPNETPEVDPSKGEVDGLAGMNTRPNLNNVPVVNPAKNL